MTREQKLTKQIDENLLRLASSETMGWNRSLLRTKTADLITERSKLTIGEAQELVDD